MASATGCFSMRKRLRTFWQLGCGGNAGQWHAPLEGRDWFSSSGIHPVGAGTLCACVPCGCHDNDTFGAIGKSTEKVSKGLTSWLLLFSRSLPLVHEGRLAYAARIERWGQSAVRALKPQTLGKGKFPRLVTGQLLQNGLTLLTPASYAWIQLHGACCTDDCTKLQSTG